MFGTAQSDMTSIEVRTYATLDPSGDTCGSAAYSSSNISVFLRTSSSARAASDEISKIERMNSLMKSPLNLAVRDDSISPRLSCSAATALLRA
jgi:hypothetical protein